MLDLGFVRANLEVVEGKLRARGADPAALLGDFRALDQSRREAITTAEQNKAQLNRLSQQVGELKKVGKDGADFLRGHFNGTSLSRDGRLSLAPKVDTLFSSGQPVIWAAAQAPDGTIYAATGHRGRVYAIDAAGKSSLLWTAEQPEVFAIAADSKGAVYAGTSPDGKVYRIVNGKAEEYFAPGARYIWSLAVGPDGALYVGTGDQGKIFRVDGPGKGELYYDTGQSHITGLAVDSQGRLLAGSGPNGILYRITAKDQAFVLYDSPLPEIRSIVPMPDGTVYAAALGGSVAQRAQSAARPAQETASSPLPTAPPPFTGEAQAGPGGEIKPPESKPQQPAAP